LPFLSAPFIPFSYPFLILTISRGKADEITKLVPASLWALVGMSTLSLSTLKFGPKQVFGLL